ncbi:MAG: response regulator [Acetatifactor sp.]|nr:response regulator [Acetatifactor sp.]
MQNILIVTEKNSLFVRSAMEHFKELEYNVVVEDLDVQKISKLKDTFEALILYMESDGHEKTQDIVYLRDKAVEEDIPIFYMGDEADELKKLIPDHVLQHVFQRPIDIKQAVQKIDEYVKNFGRQSKKKILVVDDSGAMLRNIKGWLEDKYQVILANSGAMAIKYLATNRPDLVLLDYEMPVVDGSQVLEMIRTETEFSDIPVIFLTSKNDKESILKVMALKPEGYLLKTMEPEKIVQEIDNFFEKRKRL